jgi:hypothetical protein
LHMRSLTGDLAFSAQDFVVQSSHIVVPYTLATSVRYYYMVFRES